MLGQQVYSWQSSISAMALHRVDLSEYAAGQYVVKIIAGEDVVYKRVVVGE